MATHYEAAPGFQKKVAVARASMWYKIESFISAIDNMREHNLDTVEGRNEAITAFDKIVGDGVRGHNLIDMRNPAARFKDGWEDVYVTEYDDELIRLMTMLRRQLTYRDTNIAKDTQTGRQQGAPAVGVTSEQTTQSSQDNKKAISELIITIKIYVSRDDNLWNRETVERRLGLSYV